MTKSFVPVAFQSCTSPCLYSNGLPTDSSETNCKRSNRSVFNNALLQVGSNRTSKVEFRKLASCHSLNRTIVQGRLCNGTRIFRPPFIVYKTSRQKSSCTYSVSHWCCKNVSLEITLQFRRRQMHFRRRLRERMTLSKYIQIIKMGRPRTQCTCTFFVFAFQVGEFRGVATYGERVRPPLGTETAKRQWSSVFFESLVFSCCFQASSTLRQERFTGVQAKCVYLQSGFCIQN